MRLTVITPTLNRGAMLENLLGVMEEKYPEGVEHCVIDGGSIDNTVEVLKNFSRRNRNLRWVSEPDSGQSAAMNKGIRMARSPTIGFLNVDDFYEAGTLSRICELIMSRSAPYFLVGNTRLMGADGHETEVHKPTALRFFPLMSPEMFSFPLNPVSYFYSRSIHEMVGLYDETEHFAMDYEFLIRAATAVRFRYIDEIWGTFVAHPESKTVKDFAEGSIQHRTASIRNRAALRLPRAQQILLRVWQVGADVYCRAKWHSLNWRRRFDPAP
jgi:glycosyltransferase involved in cell wall biosynthesis